MGASVVIPTRDRPEALRRCLAALATQEAADLEVVVVDDGSGNPAEIEATVEASAVSPAPRLVRGSGRGPAAARNAGTHAATGDVVLFLDDDCEPADGWASALINASRASAAAAGRTLIAPDSGLAAVASQAITEYLQLISLDPATGRLGFAPSCNLAAVASTLAQLPFDESFPGAAGEDRDWCARAEAAGVAPVYTERAVVVHRPDLSPGGFLRQQFRYGRGAARFRAAGPDRRLASPRAYISLLRFGFARGCGVGLLVLVAQVAVAAGVAVERLTSRRA